MQGCSVHHGITLAWSTVMASQGTRKHANPGMNIAYHNPGIACRLSGFRMNAFPMPFKIVATTLLTIFIVTIGVLNLRDRASWKDPTDGIFWVQTSSGLKA